MKKTNNASLCGLYAILDTATLTSQQNPLHCAEQAIIGGATILQYRDKSNNEPQRLEHAKALSKLCQQYNIIFIINDDIALAKHCHADGVHLGKDDASINIARAALGPKAIIGISCYNDFSRAQIAHAQCADYIAFGAFFPSPTKPHAAKAELKLLIQAKQELPLPICAIGGITAQNASPLIAAGADMLAVITGIFSQADIQAAAKQFSLLFKT